MGTLFIFEVMVLLAFCDFNLFDSHGREYALSFINAMPKKAFEMLLVLESVRCGNRYCIVACLLNCSPICPIVDAYLLGIFLARYRFRQSTPRPCC